MPVDDAHLEVQCIYKNIQKLMGGGGGWGVVYFNGIKMYNLCGHKCTLCSQIIPV